MINNPLEINIDKTDYELIDVILDTENPARSICLTQLTQRHKPLLIKTAEKYVKGFQSSGNLFADLQENPELIVYQAVDHYKADKNIKFSTFLSHWVRWDCLNKINDEKRYFTNEIAFDSAETKEFVESNFLDSTPLPNESSASCDDLDFIKDKADNYYDKRVSKIIDERYFSGPKLKPFNKIKECVNLSHQGVINLHDKFINEIKLDENFKNRSSLNLA